MSNKPQVILQLGYNVLMSCFLIIASPYFIVKIIMTPKYRNGFMRRIRTIPRAVRKKLHGRKLIWIHAVSVGETQTAFPVIEALKKDYPEYHIILSTTTATGQNVAKKRLQDDSHVTIVSFPLDFYHIFHSIFSELNIQLVLIMETEIWPNFLMEAHKRRVPVVVVNGRISDASFRGYSKVRRLFLASTAGITHFCMQEEEDARRLLNLGIEASRITVTNNMKYEASLDTRLNTALLHRLMHTVGWSRQELVLVCGSTHKGEEDILCASYVALKKELRTLKMILAPRHPERLGEVERILIHYSISYKRKTELDCVDDAGAAVDVVLLDTMGELRHTYALATVAFVGKSLVPGGGQNILEPASLGKPVVFGPYMDNFRRISDVFLQADAAYRVNNQEELCVIVKKLFLNRTLRLSVGQKARDEITRHSGALEKTMAVVNSILNVPQVGDKGNEVGSS